MYESIILCIRIVEAMTVIFIIRAIVGIRVTKVTRRSSGCRPSSKHALAIRTTSTTPTYPTSPTIPRSPTTSTSPTTPTNPTTPTTPANPTTRTAPTNPTLLTILHPLRILQFVLHS